MDLDEQSCQRNCWKALILPVAPEDWHEERFICEEVLRCFRQVEEPLFVLLQRWIVRVPGGFDLLESLHVWVEILCWSSIKVVCVDVSFFQALHHALVEFKDLGLEFLLVHIFLLLSANHTVDLLHKLIDALLNDWAEILAVLFVPQMLIALVLNSVTIQISRPVFEWN